MKNILITGGTGSLGKELTRHLCKNVNYHIVSLSRSELGIKNCLSEFKSEKNVHYTICDIRDKERVKSVIHQARIDTIFHLAALKHVDVIESMPEEAIKTNVIGTLNVIESAIESGRVRNIGFSSSDKAVFPINAYGHTKALGEKLCASISSHLMRIKVFRWGNVVGSNGSVLHIFKKSLLEKREVNITDMKMTRFWVSLENVAKFMIDQINKPSEFIAIPPMLSAEVVELAHAVAAYLGIDEYIVNEIGIRPGEKLHEHITETQCSEHYERYTREELMQLVGDILC